MPEARPWLLPSSTGGDRARTHLPAPHPRRAAAVHGDSFHGTNTSGVKRRYRRRRQEALPSSARPLPRSHIPGGCRATPLRYDPAPRRYPGLTLPPSFSVATLGLRHSFQFGKLSQSQAPTFSVTILQIQSREVLMSQNHKRAFKSGGR